MFARVCRASQQMHMAFCDAADPENEVRGPHSAAPPPLLARKGFQPHWINPPPGSPGSNASFLSNLPPPHNSPDLPAAGPRGHPRRPPSLPLPRPNASPVTAITHSVRPPPSSRPRCGTTAPAPTSTCARGRTSRPRSARPPWRPPWTTARPGATCRSGGGGAGRGNGEGAAGRCWLTGSTGDDMNVRTCCVRSSRGVRGAVGGASAALRAS